jgi:TonB family protein
MKALAIALAMCFLVNVLPQTESLQKQAIVLAQRTPASDLDPVLPNVSLTTWFTQLVGPRAGVIWQLSECGEAITAPGEEGPDLPACLEANAILPDGQKVVLAISIGTFKKGLTGRVAYNFGVVEYDQQLYSAKRLSDLPLLLSERKGEYVRNRPVTLPSIDADGKLIERQWLPQVNPQSLLSIDKDNDVLTANLDALQPSSLPEDLPPPPPPNRSQNTPASVIQPQSIQQVVDKVLEGNAITRVEAVYPPTARMMGAFGTVRVQVTISEAGRVIDAKAISGHQALRPAAVEAAYKWVFKPTTVNGAPVKVQGILTFNFRRLSILEVAPRINIKSET